MSNTIETSFNIIRKLFHAHYRRPKQIHKINHIFIVEISSFGVPTRVPDEIKQRIDRASDTLSISESNKKLIKSFTVTGFNVVEIGKS